MEALDVVTLVLGESMLDGFPECKNFRDRFCLASCKHDNYES